MARPWRERELLRRRIAGLCAVMGEGAHAATAAAAEQVKA